MRRGRDHVIPKIIAAMVYSLAHMNATSLLSLYLLLGTDESVCMRWVNPIGEGIARVMQ